MENEDGEEEEKDGDNGNDDTDVVEDRKKENNNDTEGEGGKKENNESILISPGEMKSYIKCLNHDSFIEAMGPHVEYQDDDARIVIRMSSYLFDHLTFKIDYIHSAMLLSYVSDDIEIGRLNYVVSVKDLPLYGVEQVPPSEEHKYHRIILTKKSEKGTKDSLGIFQFNNIYNLE